MRKLLVVLALLAAFSSQAFAQTSASTQAFRHRVGITPLAGIVAYGYVNPAMGLEYEYFLSSSNNIGLHIPVLFGFDDGAYSDFKHTSVFVAPGILFHSGTPNSRWDFAMGPSILMGNMHFQPDKESNPVGQTFDYSMFGLLANNSLNYNRKHFNMGIDFRFGPMLEEQHDQRIFWNFGCHFGGRF